MFAASLEVNTPQLLYRDQWKRFQDYWPDLLSRTKELRYNTKSDIYCKAERNLRHIYNDTLRHLEGRPKRQQPTIVPMDVDIITVKPNWLCGTFGFHPMLGFRRENQARNIAHGCAATLLRFARIQKEYLVGWGIDDQLLPRSKSFDEAHTNYKATKVKNSDCWLRPGIPCPYAADNLHKLNSSLSAAGRDQRIDRHTIGELSKIHTFCRQRKTHRPDELQS